MRRLLVAGCVLAVVLGCARSRAWVPRDGPFDRTRLERDLADCRLESDKVGHLPSFTKRNAFGACMAKRGDARGTPPDEIEKTWARLEFNNDAEACDEWTSAPRFSDEWEAQMWECMRSRRHQVPTE